MQVKRLLNFQKLEKRNIQKIFRGDFIAKCRKGNLHRYDIVEGPMADDTVWNYVNDFLYGEISREQFWALAKFKYPTYQISFHTLAAIDCLNFERSEIVYDGKRKG